MKVDAVAPSCAGLKLHGQSAGRRFDCAGQMVTGSLKKPHFPFIILYRGNEVFFV